MSFEAANQQIMTSEDAGRTLTRLCRSPVGFTLLLVVAFLFLSFIFCILISF
jgi:hypothetical protein